MTAEGVSAHMVREAFVYGTLLAAILAGLAVVVWVEATGADRMLLLVGGAVALAGFGGMVAIIARMPEPEHGEHGGH